MKYLIYISTAAELLTDPELLELLDVSRKNNEKNNITGVLLYSEGTFIQLIEGPENDLENTYNAILNDSRHRNIIKLVEENIEKRSFPGWTMGFRSINAYELESLSSYFDPNKKVFESDDHHPGLTIIKVFAENNR